MVKMRYVTLEWPLRGYMSKLADARDLNICFAWRELICLCYRIVMPRHNVNLRLTATRVPSDS